MTASCGRAFRGSPPRTAAYAIAIASAGIALLMPAMEVIPFSANLAGAALTVFGLTLIAHDGLLALIGFGITIGILGVVGYNLLFPLVLPMAGERDSGGACHIITIRETVVIETFRDKSPPDAAQRRSLG